MSDTPRAVLVTRPTPYEMLLRRHATREQARFFLESRGQSIDDAEAWHRSFSETRRAVMAAVPSAWRVARVDRDDLERFLFEPADVVVALGQDGLVANVAKYLSGQTVVGLNPDPERYEGVLARLSPADAGELLLAAASRDPAVEERTLVECALDDGQRLLALNEVFLGHRSHQTARYRLALSGAEERQLSSGVIVSTGTGATGWARSIVRERGDAMALPGPCDPLLSFLVREAFPAPDAGVSLTAGAIAGGAALTVTSEMDDGGTVFGDGIEADRVEFGYGMRATLKVADTRLRLLAA